MKQLYLCFSFFILLAFPQLGNAQDTIRVQTFTWDSDTRSEFFQFPDDPSQSYRKIWMRYNMRCHDNQVGNGNVGCREWDYSCNTFLYDPSRVDSTRQTAPTHIVSNFSGDNFEYTTQPVYDYTLYEQHDPTVTYTNEVPLAIGDGDLDVPLHSEEGVGRLQFLYPASELTSIGMTAGPIHSMELIALQPGDVDFFRIRIKTTEQTALQYEDRELDGFTEVFFQNVSIPSSGAARFDFYQPFEWDGVSNLIVELSFTSEPDGSEPTIQGHLPDDLGMTFSYDEDYSLYFSGAGQVDVPAEKLSSISDQITIELWAKGIPDIMPANSTIFEGKDANNNRQVNVHLPWGNGQVYWDCGNDGSGYDRINKQANEVDYEGQWNHWAFTKNATSGEMKIYLNGLLWHSGNGFNKPIDIEEFAIAASVTGGAQYFGNIDEFRVWDIELTPSEILAWKDYKVNDTSPNWDRLVAYFSMDDGAGFEVSDTKGGQPATVDLPYWQRQRGKDLYKNFLSASLRPNTTFIQGDATIDDVIIPVLDSIIAPQHSVTYHGLDGTDLIVTDVQYFYGAGQAYVYDEDGQVVDSVAVAPEGSIEIGELTHYTKADAKFELLSLVTPYGNGLGLGAEGKTFWFDVTHFAPILRGEKRISIEMGGQWQEELDIEFLFITGTPPRDPIEIQHIWPFRRGWFGDIQSDRFFEPRTLSLLADGRQFELHSAITGHGQNGEFVSRNHYLNLNGGGQDFTYDVWKECANNPIYPQGGTWIFDRAGWCPGEATDIHKFDISSMVTPGGEVEVDYGVNGSNMTEANYLVNNQLVTFGDWNFNLDASLERIARPNSVDVEFERINPVCTTPLVRVRNTGANEIVSVEIEYQVRGNGGALTHEWTGSLQSGETTDIELPVTDLGFWNSTEDDLIFEAEIISVNEMEDAQPENNMALSPFELADVYQYGWEYLLRTQTNNNGSDYSYTIWNASGDIVMERDDMDSNTQYDDNLELEPGCYTLEFDDASDDGLSFWFFPNNGSGSLRFMRIVNTFIIAEHSFNPDFGTGVQYDFVIEGPSNSDEEVRGFHAFSTWPNPTSGNLNVELRGFQGEEISLELTDLQGRILQSQNSLPGEHWQSELDLNHLPNGMYFLRVVSEGKVYTKQVLKQ